jgi:hypothetical protein
MGITGNPRVGSLYPRIIYGSPAVTLEFADPALAELPSVLDQVRSESTSPSGRRKVLIERTEETRTIVWPNLDANEAFQLWEFFRTWGGPGKQFELYLNRFQGAALEFEGTLADQQGTLGTFTGTPSYEAATFGKGLRLDPGGEFLDFPTAPAGQQPSLLAAEGILVLIVRPGWAGNDGSAHRFLDINAGAQALLLDKTASNVLQLRVSNASGDRQVDIAVSWASNAEQKIVAKWKDSSNLELWLNGVKGPAPSGAGNGTLTALPTNLRIGAVDAVTALAYGLYDRLGFFTRAFDLNASVVSYLTDSYFPRWKNYYATAEVLDPRLATVRRVPGRDLWQAAMTFRAGVA